MNTPSISSNSPKKSRLYRLMVLSLLGVLVLVLLLVLLLYLAMATPMGSKWLLEKIASEANISLSYGKGNLRDGIWVNDVHIGAGEPIEITINEGYVQIGWRAIFARQVHLSAMTVDKVTVLDHNPPSDEPFDYPTLTLPVDVLLEQTTINQIVYDKAKKDPISLHDIAFNKASWYGADVVLSGASIGVDDVVDVQDIDGKITLSGDYPLAIDAKVIVNRLSEHHIAPLMVQATGSLKHTKGRISSLYNNANVAGEFSVQGLEDDAPFWAKINFDKVPLPYAPSQNIVLSDGSIVAQGVLSAIELQVDTKLTGVDVPDGRYRGQAVIADDTMTIEQLTLTGKHGDLSAQGQIDWRDEITVSLVAKSNNYRLQQAMPDDYSEYRAYLPKRLDGTLAFDYQSNASGDSVYQIKLAQKNGELMSADIRQKNPTSQTDHPWRINADWQNLKRDNLPTLGRLISDYGSIKVQTHKGKTSVEAAAYINALSGLPVGRYEVNAELLAQKLTLNAMNYNGDMGKLTADGVVYLATDERPLSYQIVAKTDGLSPNRYFDEPNKTPIDSITGQLIVAGQLQSSQLQSSKSSNKYPRRRNSQDSNQINSSQIDGGQIDSHDIRLTADGLSVRLDDGKTATLNGDGTIALQLHNKQLTHSRLSFDGVLATDGLATGLARNDVSLLVSGTGKHLTLDKVAMTGQTGKLLATGSVDLSDGLAWQVSATTNQLDLSAFYPKAPVMITGELTSQGQIRQGNLQALHSSFDGDISSNHTNKGLEQDLSGQLQVAIQGANQHFVIDKLYYKGQAGVLSGTGQVDLSDGVRGEFDVAMDKFDVGVVNTQYSSSLSGQVVASVDWGRLQQVHISQMDVSGTVNNENFLATGSLGVVLDLPKDWQAFWQQLQPKGFDIDQLSDKYRTMGRQGKLGNTNSLEQTLIRQNTAFNQVVKKLQADDVKLQWGDNDLLMAGNEQNLQLTINAQTLSQLVPSLRGKVVGSLVLSNNNKPLPDIDADLLLADISTSSLKIGQAQVVGKIVALGNKDSRLKVQASDLAIGQRRLTQLTIDAKGSQKNHTIALLVSDNKMQGRMGLQGGFDGRHYTGVLNKAMLQSDYGQFVQIQPTEIAFDKNKKSLRVAAHCWQTQTSIAQTTGSLCLAKPLQLSPDDGAVQVVVDKLDMRVLTPLLPNELSVNAKLNGAIDAKWGKTIKPIIGAVLYADNGTVGLRNDGLPDSTMAFDRVSLIAKSVPTGLKLRADLQAGQAGKGYVDVVIDPYQSPKPIAGSLNVSDFNLSVLRPFFPAIQTLAGDVNVAGGVGGTLSKPLFYGTVGVDNGKLGLSELPIALNNLTATATVEGTKASLDGAFNSGDGTAKIDGSLDWQNTLQANLTLTGEQLAISNPPLLSAKVNPNLSISLRPSEKYVAIKGVIAVPSATIRPPEANNKEVIEQSDDVVVLDRRMTGSADALLQRVAPWSINADIGLDLGDDVVFRGFGANLPLAGALHLTQKGQGTMQARGMIQVSERSKVDIVGQNLELNYAQIRFNGAIKNPRLSIEAVRTIDDQTIGVAITNTVASPTIKVFNDAGLSEQQAMNALITGRLSETNTQVSEQGFRSRITNQLAAAGLSLGLKSTQGFTNELGRSLGLEGLVLGASGVGEQTNVSVTGYISPDLYIRYGVGVFNAESSLSMRYQLTRRVYVEASSATEKVIDVVYRWQF